MKSLRTAGPSTSLRFGRDDKVGGDGSSRELLLFRKRNTNLVILDRTGGTCSLPVCLP
jgi:hypothetical protein